MSAPTAGFGLSALPATPTIPSNIGKVDVNGIYDNVVQALQTHELLNSSAGRQAVTAAQQVLAQKKAETDTGLLAPEAAAAKAKAVQATSLAAPDMTAGLRSKTLAGFDADLVAEQNRRNIEQFKGGLTPTQQLVLAAAGPSTNTSTNTSVGNGVVNSTTNKTASIAGGPAVPVATESSTSPSAPILTPIPGAGGFPGPTAVGTVQPGGKLSTELAQPPLGALNGINTGTTYVKLGSRRDDQGNVKDVYQAMGTTAAGGAPKPIGAPVETVAGSGPPGTAPTAAAQPFISKIAADNIQSVTAEMTKLQERKMELQNIAHSAENFIGTGAGAGRFTGPLRAFLGDAKAQEFVGSIQNALQTALLPLRGTGRVAVTEFNQALGALPKVDDQAETIRAKLAYLNLVTDWGTARQQAVLDALGQGLSPYNAYKKALVETPIPEIPDFSAGAVAPTYQPTTGASAPAAAAPAAPGAAASAAPGKFKVIEVK